MAAGTKIRALSRLLDASPAPVWVIGSSGNLIYLSSAVSTWLGLDVDSLLQRRCVAGAAISNDPLDFVAASLAPPTGINEQGSASLRVQPPSIDGRKIDPINVRFLRVGETSGFVVAIAGRFDEPDNPVEIQDAVALRKSLDAWRKQHAAIATVATAGVSTSARRLRSRLQVAASTRTHIGFFGPKGCGSVSIASRVHEASAPGELLVQVDGTLMDAELLDATMSPAVHVIADSKSHCATVLLRDLDETPYEAQERLASLLTSFGGRLRLLATSKARIKTLSEPLDESGREDLEYLDEHAGGIHTRLIDFLSGMTVTVDPLGERPDDIPVLATAALDARLAAGESQAERFSRAALDALIIYPWPGNFEELSAAIRHAAKTARQAAIGVEHLPLAIRSYRPGENPVSDKVANIDLDEAVRRFEMRLITETLQAADGNRAEAARRLGISRARLLRKLEDAGDV